MTTAPRPPRPPEEMRLDNWRQAPYSRWAFQNVRELIPSAAVFAAKKAAPLPRAPSTVIAGLRFPQDHDATLETLLEQSHSDSLVLLYQGRKVWQWNAAHCDIERPHILFSISKSITGMLAGILVEQGVIEVDKTVLHYLPGMKGSAYEDCTVQQVLDMSVALAFEESYLNEDGDYRRYRDATGWNPVDQTRPGVALEHFLTGLRKANFSHGDMFNYRSPNADLLGLLLERAAGMAYADLVSSLIWRPMGAETDGYVTVDRVGQARAAGGICATVDDLARFGLLVLNRGVAHDGQRVIPENWISDTLTRGDRRAWQQGEYQRLLPQGGYRNQWYQVGDREQCFMARGIHGQWLYVNPATSVVIARLASQPLPVDERLDLRLLDLFARLSSAFEQ